MHVRNLASKSEIFELVMQHLDEQTASLARDLMNRAPMPNVASMSAPIRAMGKIHIPASPTSLGSMYIIGEWYLAVSYQRVSCASSRVVASKLLPS